MDSAGETLVWVAPGDTIRGRLSTVCVSNNKAENAVWSCVILSNCCAIMGEKLQYFSCLHMHVIYTGRRMKKYLAFISFKNIQIYPLVKYFLLLLYFEFNLGLKYWNLFFPSSGQKFAMMELKSTISHVLRSFKVIECDSKDEISYSLDFTLKSTVGLKVKLELR
jgi:hypothetical protein